MARINADNQSVKVLFIHYQMRYNRSDFLLVITDRKTPSVASHLSPSVPIRAIRGQKEIVLDRGLR